MSEFHFGLGRGHVSEEVRRRVDQVAEKHDCTFVAVNLPGDGGPRYWFSGPNRGSPFDAALARRVASDLVTWGLDIDALSGGDDDPL